MSFTSEKTKIDIDHGYCVGWKDGYNEGYDAAWKEMKELKKAEEDEDPGESQFPINPDWKDQLKEVV